MGNKRYDLRERDSQLGRAQVSRDVGASWDSNGALFVVSKTLRITSRVVLPRAESHGIAS